MSLGPIVPLALLNQNLVARRAPGMVKRFLRILRIVSFHESYRLAEIEMSAHERWTLFAVL
jgi:hypothetical protein